MVALVVSITGDTKGLSKALGSAGGDVSGFGSSILGTAGKVSIIAGAALAAGAAIAGMTKAAADDRAEQQKLTAAIQAVGAETANTTAQVDAAIESGQEKAFTDTETREALQSLVTATKDVGAATALLTDAQNISRLAGVDLATASDAVAKAHAGNDKALRSLIPGMKKGASAVDTLAEASKLAAGQADIYSQSAEGMQKRGGDAFGELAETIGEVFLPVLDAVLPVFIELIKALGVIVKAILPLLIPLIKVWSIALSVVVKVLTTIVGWIAKLITWLTKAIGKIGQFLDSINPFKGIKLPSLPFLSSTAAIPAGGATTRTGQSGGATGGITFNIYGDPAVIEARVIRALRAYQSRNGVGSVFSPGRV